MAANPPPGPLSDYTFDAKKNKWVSISSQPTAKRVSSKSPKPVGYLSERHTPGFEAKLKGKSWWTERHMRKNDAAKQNKKRASYGSNRQVGLFAEKEYAAKRGQTPTRGASTGGAGSSRSITKPGSNEPSPWAKAAFAKIVKEHPQGIDFKALRNWDNEDKAYNANPNLRRGRNANPDKNRQDSLKLRPGIDFAALRAADKNWGKSKSMRSGPQ